ncbi:MAG: hypothetical protein ACXADA_20005 [Candidatus Hodarchaeales archaeon]|jgi:hypothetical protein
MALNQEKKPNEEKKSSVGELFKGFIDFHFASRIIFIIFVFVCIIRIVVIIIDPLVTSDLLRNIFYGQHFWTRGFGVYDLLPQELDASFSIIDPLCGDQTNPDCLSWPNNMYDYPSLHLLFFAVIALTPLPVIFSKLVLALFDIINFFILNSKEDYKSLAWVYFLINIPFSSLEGQIESITIFFFLAGLYLYEKDHKWIAYFVAGLGFQWKIIPVVLFPYFLIKDIFRKKDEYPWSGEKSKALVLRMGWFAIPVIILSLLPLLDSKYLLNSQFIRGFQYDVDSWNPLYLFNLTPSAILLVITAIFVAIFWINMLEFDWRKGIDYFLFLELCFFFSIIYKYAMPWAWLYFIPALVVIPYKKEMRYKEIFLMLIITLVFASMDFFNMTIGLEGLEHLIKTLMAGI